MISSAKIAVLFSALSHPARVDILKCLLSHAPDGLNLGELGKIVRIPNSTLKHHLNEMQSGGVIEQTRKGRCTQITVSLRRLAEVTTVLSNICCTPQNLELAEKEDS